MSHPSELIFAAGMARPSSATPIAVQYDLLLVTFTFLRDTGIIQDAEAIWSAPLPVNICANYWWDGVYILNWRISCSNWTAPIWG